MTEPTPAGRTDKIRDAASSAATYVLEALHDRVVEVKAERAAEREANLDARNAVREVSDMLAKPRTDDPLFVIREIENLLGMEHYDWSKYGRWRRIPTKDV